MEYNQFMTTSILVTKLFIPPTRPELVPRPRLIERLDAGLHRKLTLISAPAGFGKTTLVTEWLDSLRLDAQKENQNENRIAGSHSMRVIMTRRVSWLTLSLLCRRLRRILEKGCWECSNPLSHRQPNRF